LVTTNGTNYTNEERIGDHGGVRLEEGSFQIIGACFEPTHKAFNGEPKATSFATNVEKVAFGLPLNEPDRQFTRRLWIFIPRCPRRNLPMAQLLASIVRRHVNHRLMKQTVLGVNN
jgi:hypothetical protein